ncbi:MAG: hypothetical protein AABY18_00635 [Candidatus Thermoplasmatota archaeon]
MTRPPLRPLLASPRTRYGMAFVALVAAAAIAGPSILQSYGNGSAGTQSDPLLTSSFQASADAITQAAVADMQAIALASAEAMAEAGAASEAEYAAVADEASRSIVQASAVAEEEVAHASAARAGLLTAPAGYEEGDNVTASETEVGEYDTPTFEAEPSHRVDHDTKPYEGTDSEVKARVALNVPVTGVGPLDAAGMALVELYVIGKQQAHSNEDTNILWESDAGTIESDGENATYSALPDDDGAAAAAEHAANLLGSANATFGSLLSGVHANVEVQAGLLAAVEAEINATLAAEAEAEAAIDATVQQSADATLAASAQAEVEAHAAAERKLELVETARLEARRQVSLQAQQQVEVVSDAAIRSQQQLEQQAQAATAAGAQAAAQIRAAAQAAANAVATLPGINQTEAGARAQAILTASAQAEAQAWAKANTTAKALLKQSSMVAGQADLRIKAMLSAQAKAEAAIDAKAELAVRATLRAEAYTVAKVRADAAAKLQTNLRAAGAAKFKAHAAAESHIRVVIKAGFGLTAAAKVSFDGSRQMGDQVGTHADVQATRDIDYVREVQRDWEGSRSVEAAKQAEHWEAVGDDLDLQKTVVLGTAYEIDQEVERGLDLVLLTRGGLTALGQEYL